EIGVVADGELAVEPQIVDGRDHGAEHHRPEARDEANGHRGGGHHPPRRGRRLARGHAAQLRPRSSLATVTTPSGPKPTPLCSSLSGAEGPNVFMPMTFPALPT